MAFVFLWLTCFTQHTPSRSLHVVANGQISFFFVAEERAIERKCRLFFTQSSTDGTLVASMSRLP